MLVCVSGLGLPVGSVQVDLVSRTTVSRLWSVHRGTMLGSHLFSPCPSSNSGLGTQSNVVMVLWIWCCHDLGVGCVMLLSRSATPCARMLAIVDAHASGTTSFGRCPHLCQQADPQKHFPMRWFQQSLLTFGIVRRSAICLLIFGWFRSFVNASRLLLFSQSGARSFLIVGCVLLSSDVKLLVAMRCSTGGRSGTWSL